MKIFKFGGASVSTVERIQHIAAILQDYREEPLMIIVSAIGKTTNALEKVAEAWFAGKKEDALELFRQVRHTHDDFAKYLLVREALPTEHRLNDLYTEVEWLLHDKPVREYDYYYDQIVCIGELLSTTIISAYLNEEGLSNEWVDVRDVFRTDDNFRDAGIDWTTTRKQSDERIRPLFKRTMRVITQGFIGSTDENESTTLGREGSDYTAAIFASLLDAESLTIWKDVKGVMNADPKQFPTAEIISELSYEEVIEMAYYGAQVIHPKTIKPLQNRQIPLYVRSFIDPEAPGTIIHQQCSHTLPPIIVIKKNQVLLQLKTMDFSFVGEKPVAELYHWLEQVRIRPNLISTGAVSVQVCLDDHPEKIDRLASLAATRFDVQVERGYMLLTIRHPQKGLLEGLTQGQEIPLLQQNRDVVQALLIEKNR